MQTAQLSRLLMARVFDPVRRVRQVRARDDRCRMRWAVALRILGRWRVVGREPMTSPWLIQRDPWLNPRPMLFSNVRTARPLLATLDL